MSVDCILLPAILLSVIILSGCWRLLQQKHRIEREKLAWRDKVIGCVVMRGRQFILLSLSGIKIGEVPLGTKFIPVGREKTDIGKLAMGKFVIPRDERESREKVKVTEMFYLSRALSMRIQTTKPIGIGELQNEGGD